MDPNSGRIYADLATARAAGVEHPVEVIGRREDVERVSTAVRKLHDREKKRAKSKAAKHARRINR